MLRVFANFLHKSHRNSLRKQKLSVPYGLYSGVFPLCVFLGGFTDE